MLVSFDIGNVRPIWIHHQILGNLMRFWAILDDFRKIAGKWKLEKTKSAENYKICYFQRQGCCSIFQNPCSTSIHFHFHLIWRGFHMFRASTKAKNSFLKEILQETGKSPLLKESFLKGGSWRKLRGEREDSQRIMRNLALQSHCHRRLKKKIKFTILGQLQPNGSLRCRCRLVFYCLWTGL